MNAGDTLTTVDAVWDAGHLFICVDETYSQAQVKLSANDVRALRDNLSKWLLEYDSYDVDANIIRDLRELIKEYTE